MSLMVEPRGICFARHCHDVSQAVHVIDDMYDLISTRMQVACGLHDGILTIRE
jgi:hypothetical protein